METRNSSEPWNRLFRVGSFGFTFPQACRAVIQQLDDEIHWIQSIYRKGEYGSLEEYGCDERQWDKMADTSSLEAYHNALEVCSKDYQERGESRKLRLISEWKRKGVIAGQEDFAHIAQAWEEDDLGRLPI